MDPPPPSSTQIVPKAVGTSLRELLDVREHSGLPVKLRRVRGVHVDTNADEDSLDGLLGAGVHHFRPHGGRVGVPRHEDELGRGSAIVSLEFNVNQAVAGLVLGEGLEEVLVGVSLREKGA